MQVSIPLQSVVAIHLTLSSIFINTVNEAAKEAHMVGLLALVVYRSKSFSYSLFRWQQSFLIHTIIPVLLVLCEAKRPLWWVHLNVLELKFGRSTPGRSAIWEIPALGVQADQVADQLADLPPIWNCHQW